VALNYTAHAAEGDQPTPSAPLFFLKSSASLLGHRQTVIAPRLSQRVDYEAELAVIIGRHCRDLTLANWQQAVAGYSIINDVTARDLQIRAIEANQPWDRTKSFDTFGPLGPWLVTPDEVPDPQNLEVELRVGDMVRQSSNTRHMLFSVAQLLVTISDGITLEPGDILATGTPHGIGPVADTEVMYARIGHLGTLINPVAYPAQQVNQLSSAVPV
jgi:2-keto-4-pentenoate hydratase/2-oxohepta-3-ene-1,7-dioic acid hydratase in catechol pathway